MTGSTVKWVVALAAVAVCPAAARGADGLAKLLDPRLGHAKSKAVYRAAGYPSASVRGQAADLGFAQHEMLLTAPLRQDETAEWTVTASLKALDINTGAKLPGFAQAFPEDLWDVRMGATHRRKLDNGWLAGGAAEIGSASDAPFSSTGETTVTTTGYLRIPAAADDAWLVMLRFRTELDALRGAPLMPGIGYHWVKDDRFQALLGVPFAWAEYRPVDDLKFTGLAGPSAIKAECSYALSGEVTLHAGYDWSSQRFVRRKRVHGNERLFYYGQRVTAGVRWDVTPHVWIDAGGGYAFGRFFFEGKRYHNRHGRRFRLGDTPFVALRAGLSY